MAKNDFRVASIFKIIIRICIKNVEFCRKASKFLPKRCVFIHFLYFFYLNEIKGVQPRSMSHLIKYVENETSNSIDKKNI